MVNKPKKIDPDAFRSGRFGAETNQRNRGF